MKRVEWTVTAYDKVPTKETSMTPEIKRAIKDALFKLDDCRAWLEDTQTMVEHVEDPDMSEQCDDLYEDIQDALVSIYQIDQALTNHIKEEVA